MNLRILLKKILPRVIVYEIQQFQHWLQLNKAYKYDLRRYFKYSRIYNEKTPIKFIGEIITLYHVLEKGLTMPSPRLGFGREKVIKLCNLCSEYIEKFSLNSFQLTHAIQVINEYEKFHIIQNFVLDDSVLFNIHKIKEVSQIYISSNQINTTINDYFKNSLASFDLFSESRKSIRNFNASKTIEKHILYSAVELAQNTPSACNRQSWATYIISDKMKLKQILEIQGGNRGFGDLGDKLIIIVGEIGVFSNVSERNQVFIDGGMYAMNILYALHFKHIAACTLNCSHSPEKDIILREMCQIKESEVFIAMILCGIPPDTFSVAISPRNPFETTIRNYD